MSLLLSAALVVARVVYVACIVVSLLAFPEARKLLKPAWTEAADGGTLYAPLVLCEPSTIDVDGTVLTIDASQTEGCFALDFLVNACAASLLLSAVGMVVYLAGDFWWRCSRPDHRWHLSRNATAGFFLAVVYLQAGFCVGSLAKQADFWVGYISRTMQKLDEGDGAGTAFAYSSVTTYGSRTLLWIATGFSFLGTITLCLESAIGFCYRGEESRRNHNDGDPRRSLEDLEKARVSQQHEQQPCSTDKNVVLETGRIDTPSSNSPKSPSWTNVDVR